MGIANQAVSLVNVRTALVFHTGSAPVLEPKHYDPQPDGPRVRLVIWDPNHAIQMSEKNTFMAGQPTPPNRTPPQEIAGLMIRAYENPLVSLNKAGQL